MTGESEEELEGAKIKDKNDKKPKIQVDHLSDHMKKLVEKYPETVKDDLYGSRAFQNMPYQEIELDEEIKPVSHSYVKTTPIHLRETSKGFLKNLQDQGIISPQPDWTPWCSSGFLLCPRGA